MDGMDAEGHGVRIRPISRRGTRSKFLTKITVSSLSNIPYFFGTPIMFV